VSPTPWCLRYGAFYGPGTWYARDSAIVQMMRRRPPRLQK
jgi:hypothetical protein